MDVNTIGSLPVLKLLKEWLQRKSVRNMIAIIAIYVVIGLLMPLAITLVSRIIFIIAGMEIGIAQSKILTGIGIVSLISGNIAGFGLAITRWIEG